MLRLYAMVVAIGMHFCWNHCRNPLTKTFYLRLGTSYSRMWSYNQNANCYCKTSLENTADGLGEDPGPVSGAESGFSQRHFHPECLLRRRSRSGIVLLVTPWAIMARMAAAGRCRRNPIAAAVQHAGWHGGRGRRAANQIRRGLQRFARPHLRRV